MPSIGIYTPLVCVHCGRQATYISVHKKIPRCEKYSSHCPAIVASQKAGREKSWAASPGAKEQHMKKMSTAGNASEKKKVYRI